MNKKDLAPLPAEEDAQPVCEAGGEKAGYALYKKLLSEGKRCDLFAGENAAKPEGYAEVYAVSGKGVTKC